MLKLMIVFFLFMGMDDDPIKEDPTKDLTALLNKMIGSESYSFQVEIKDDGGGFMRRRGRDGQENQKAPVIKGRYHKDEPLYLKSGTLEVYSLGEDMVYQMGDGKWELYDPQAMRGRFGGRGGEGRQRRAPRLSEAEMLERFDQDKDGQLSEEERAEASRVLREERQQGGERGERRERGERGEREEKGEHKEESEKTEAKKEAPPRPSSFRDVMNLTRLTSPMDAANKVLGKVESVVCEKGEDKIVYKGVLNKEGAESLSVMARFSRMRGRSMEGGPEFKTTGDVCVIANPTGIIKKIEIKTTTSGAFREREFTMTRTLIYQFDKFGGVEVKIPAEAMEKFEL